MGIETKPVRYAHSEGYTDVCYSEDGKYLITCGSEGDVRIWSGFDDDDPNQACVGEWSSCVCQKAGQLHVSNDNNQVQVLTFPESERDGILARFAARVNHMAVSREHDLMAIGTDDAQLKLVDLRSKESLMRSYEGPVGPILSVALCPRAKLVAASSGDELLRIWDIESGTLLKDIKCVPKINSFANAKILARIDFDPSTGRSLAYPINNSVIIMNTLDWTSKLVLMCTEVSSPYLAVRYSPCGNMLAAASTDGHFVVWNVNTQNIVGITKHRHPDTTICAMAWNPSENGEIAICDLFGQLGLVIITVASSNSSSEIDSKIAIDNSEVNSILSNENQFVPVEDDEDNENAISLEKLKHDIMGDSNDEHSNIDQESVRSPSPSRPRSPKVPLQDSFMPSSTPEHLNPRYLCWNEVGIVRSYNCNTDDDNKQIEVEFHDTMFHNSIMLKNYNDYTMGSLSTSALTIANSSQVTIIPLGSTSKEWNVTLSEEENIICVACSSNLVCIATADFRVRIYSIYGSQKAVFAVSGPLVSMAVRGVDVLIAYHISSPRKDDQCIGMMSIKLTGISVRNSYIGNVPLRPYSKLQWLGYTDRDTPAVQDSSGMLYLHPLTSNLWLPFCDTTQSFQLGDGFFVTAVFESYQVVRGIRCRGSLYPAFTPQPTAIELPLLPPFFESGTEKSRMEAELFMWSTLCVDNTEKKVKETALKTFALSCRNNFDQRALEFIESVANSQLLELAIKYATKLNRPRLVEKLAELSSSIQALNEDRNYDEKKESISCSSIIKPVPNLTRKLVLKARANSDKRAKSTEIGATFRENESDITVPNVSLKSSADTTLTMSEDDGISTTQDSVFSNCEVKKNPFLKRIKEDRTNRNPLSLTDKNAGYEEDKKVIEKRKITALESDTDQQRVKQRRLDAMFGKKLS